METIGTIGICGEYIIPEGFQAEIKDGKIIVRKKESDDEMTRKNILALVKKHAVNHERCQMEAYLEKQKEKSENPIIPEWSDYDEKMLVSILWHVSYSVSNGKQTDCHCDLTDWLKALQERLKSLRPQPNNNLRWRRAKAGENIPESIIIPDGEEPRFGKCAVKDSYYIPISELKELPKE